MSLKAKIMFFINFLLFGLAKIAIQCLSYKQLSRHFGKSCRMLVASTLLSKQQLQQALMIKRAIALTLRYLPWEANCLPKALVARFWCKYYHVPYLLFIGLAKDKKISSRIDAHAWITAGPIAITGEFSFETYHVICSYSNAL